MRNSLLSFILLDRWCSGRLRQITDKRGPEEYRSALLCAARQQTAVREGAATANRRGLSSLWSGTVMQHSYQPITTTSVACRPFCPCSTLNSTLCPSSRFR